jgi:YHS domain-containing protein
MKTLMHRGMVLGGVILLLGAVTPSYGQEDQKKAEGKKAPAKPPAVKETPAKTAVIKCPVSGRPVQMARSAKYKDGKVYFCCSGCVDKFKEDAKPFAEAADAQLEAIGAGAKVVQFACPMCSKPHQKAAKRPVKKGLLAVKLAEVYFCCADCAKAFEKDDDQAATEKLESVLTSQTACPFTGEPIDVEISAEYKGKRIFFSSKKCLTGFEKDKDGVLVKLKAGAGFLAAAKVEKVENKSGDQPRKKNQDEG